MADLFTIPPLPQTSFSVDLYNADTFVLRTVVSLVCPFDSGKTSPCEKLCSKGTSVYISGRVLLVRENPFLYNTDISVSIGSRDATQSLPLNKDNAVTRAPTSVPVVSSVTNYDHSFMKFTKPSG